MRNIQGALSIFRGVWILLISMLFVPFSRAQSYGLPALVPIGKFLDGALPATTPSGVGSLVAPATLSGTGAFSSLLALTPRAGLVPYDVNTPLWSDGARKKRWIAVPNDGTADSAAERIGFSTTASWSFPKGTVLMKHFELPNDDRNPALVRRLETRFLVHGDDGIYYGLTYRWLPDGSDAELLPDGYAEPISIRTASGGTRTQTWTYPSRADCLSCHNTTAGMVLGVRTHQLNRAFAYPSTNLTDNQLRALNHLGLFSPVIDEATIPTMPKAAALTDSSRSLEDRVRSYLDSNCSQCHKPGNLATAFDARYTTPLSEQRLIDGPVLYDLGIAEGRVIAPQSLDRSLLYYRLSVNNIHRMPPIGRDVVDETAVGVVRDWIMTLTPDGTTDNHPPVAVDDEAVTLAGVAVDIPILTNDADADGDAFQVARWTSPTSGQIAWPSGGFARFTPAAGFTGTVTFTYVLSDGVGAESNTATVTVRVISGSTSSAVAFLDQSSRLADPSWASGVAMGVADMNRDGLDDIVHLNGATTLRIDYQQPNGARFTSMTLGQVSTTTQWGLAIGDADNNGYPDIITGGYKDGLHYYRANAAGSAYARTDLTSPVVFLQAINFADINEDGWLDVFACHDLGENAKFRNRGDGTFVADNSLIDTTTVPTSDNSGNYGTVWTDYDGDGDLDLYISKCRSGVSSSSDPRRVNKLMRNNGDGTYTEAGTTAGLAIGQQSWAADFGDIDNDGDLDCFVGNHSAASMLLRNLGNGTFSAVLPAVGVNVNWRVIQTVFRDFNNDGWLDLFLVGERQELWLNNRSGGFTLAANPFGSFAMESCAVGDLNHDGFTDIYGGYASLYNSPNTSRPDKLWMAAPNGNAFLSVTLEGTASNRLASGARLELYGPWGVQVREVRSGESYGVSHAFTQIFGMGSAPTADRLIVRWPSGAVDEIVNVEGSRFVNLREGSSAAPSLTGPQDQVHHVGEAVTVGLVASDPTGDALTFKATNLPAGLTINSATGLISGVPVAGSEGIYSVVVSAEDAWTRVSHSFGWTIIGRTAPTVQLSSASATVTGAFDVGVRFSAPVTGLALNDFSVTGATLSQLSGTGSVYSVRATPTAPGAIVISLPANRAVDAFGQGNVASNLLPVTFTPPDTTPPSVTLLRVSGDRVSEPVTIEIAFSESVSGVDLSDFLVTNATLSALTSQSASNYTLLLSPQVEGGVTLRLPPGTVVDGAGNVNTASNELALTYVITVAADALNPVVLPTTVRRGEALAVKVDYDALARRELQIILHDPQNGYRVEGSYSLVVEPGAGTVEALVDVAPDARIGAGFLWALRLIPEGGNFTEAVVERYIDAVVEEGSVMLRDLVDRFEAPAEVQRGETALVTVDYQATTNRDLQLLLQDSQDNWRTIGQAFAQVTAGRATRTFQVTIADDARVGTGYVWVARLLPGGGEFTQALAEAFLEATVTLDDGGAATQDAVVGFRAPAVVQRGNAVSVSVDYEALGSRDLHVLLLDSQNDWRVIGEALTEVAGGIGARDFTLGIASGARLGEGYVWVAQLLPLGAVDGSLALDQRYANATVEEAADGVLVNYAVLPQSTATQSSVYGDYFRAQLARDGNTDGDWRNGSVTHTEYELQPWWEVDLGEVKSIDHLLVWNRTDCCEERLSDFYVFVSDGPFLSTGVTETISQPGVKAVFVPGTPSPTSRVLVGRSGRYVRVQLSGEGYLSLAEVDVLGENGGALVHGVTYSYYEGAWSSLPDFAAIPLRSTGTGLGFSLSERRRDDYFALRFTGCLNVTVPGDYALYTLSDAGSRFYVEGQLIVDNDGEHMAQEASGTVALDVGMHPFEVQYFESDGPEELVVSWSGPSIPKQPIPLESLRVNETGVSPAFQYALPRMGAEENSDGDLLDLAAEYALGKDPFDPLDGGDVLKIDTTTFDGNVVVSYRRPRALQEYSYVLECSEDLVHWNDVLGAEIALDDQTREETVRYVHLERQGPVTASRGFVRLRMHHRPWNHISYSPVAGWQETSFHDGYQTYGIAFVKAPSFAGSVMTVRDGGLVPVAPGLGEVPKEAAYLEFASGPWEGHRVDIDWASTTDQWLALDFGAAHNTLSSLPEDGLAGERFRIRPHQTLGGVFPLSQYHGSGDPEQADQIHFFTGQGYEAYFLLEAGGYHRWVRAADVDLADAAKMVIPPGTGCFVKRPPGAGNVDQIMAGQVRTHGFAQALRPGYNLLAPAAPVLGTPNERGLTQTDHFRGSADPSAADQVHFWLGDRAAAAAGQGYESFFLLDSNGQRYWTSNTSVALDSVDDLPIFSPDRAFFLQRTELSSDDYVVPSSIIHPWGP